MLTIRTGAYVMLLYAILTVPWRHCRALVAVIRNWQSVCLWEIKLKSLSQGQDFRLSPVSKSWF